MKVDIGPYPNPMTTHRLECAYLERMYGEDWHEVKPHQYIWVDHIVIGLLDLVEEYILEPLNKIFCKRRIKVKYHNYDTWSLDHTLAVIILPGLKQLKATQHGHPCDVDENQWYEILDKMIFAFDEIANEYPGEEAFRSGTMDVSFEKIDGSKNYSMVEGPNHNYSVDWEGRKMYDDRIQEGLNLFGKYYRNLWD